MRRENEYRERRRDKKEYQDELLDVRDGLSELGVLLLGHIREDAVGQQRSRHVRCVNGPRVAAP